MKLDQMAKQDVLKEIMGMMDDLMKKKLKGQSPKAMEIEIDAEPSDEDEEGEESQDATSAIEKKMAEMSSDESSEGNEEDSEDLQRLKDLYSKLK